MGGSVAQRSDAQQNREHAGIGAGTLYRHFPTREALILAVYRHDVQRLVGSVPDVLATNPPLDAFRVWFHTLADYVRVKHGLGEALHSAAVRDAINDTYKPVVTAVGQLIDACVADGSMRAGLDPDDVLLLMGFMWRVDADPDGKTQAARIMELVIEGLRP
jgi:AcrR family transcriptional regulator